MKLTQTGARLHQNLAEQLLDTCLLTLERRTWNNRCFSDKMQHKIVWYIQVHAEIASWNLIALADFYCVIFLLISNLQAIEIMQPWQAEVREQSRWGVRIRRQFHASLFVSEGPPGLRTSQSSRVDEVHSVVTYSSISLSMMSRTHILLLSIVCGWAVSFPLVFTLG